MAASNTCTKWASGAPLDRAWVEFSEIIDEASALLVSCCQWLIGSDRRAFTAILESELAERRPKTWFDKLQRQEDRRETLQTFVTLLLANGCLTAYGVRVSPTMDSRPVVLPAAVFAAALSRNQAIRWETNVVEVGQLIVGDIRIVSENAAAKKGFDTDVDLMVSAIELALTMDRGLLKNDAKIVMRLIKPVVQAHEKFERIREPQIATTRRALAILRPKYGESRSARESRFPDSSTSEL